MTSTLKFAQPGSSMSGDEMLRHFDAWFQEIENQIAGTENPRHRHMLTVYLKHLSLEFAGDVASAMTPDMMVENPYYYMRFEPAGGVEYVGRAGVEEFYAGMFASAVVCVGGWNAVADWGVMSLKEITQFLPGSTVKMLGVDVGVENDNDLYVVSCPTVVRWPFDDTGRLAGEECWQREPYEVVKATDANLLTAEQIAVVAAKHVPV